MNVKTFSAVAALHLAVLFSFTQCSDQRTTAAQDDTPGKNTAREAPAPAKTGARNPRPASVPSPPPLPAFQPVLRDMPDDLAALTGYCKTGVLLDWTNRRILWQKQKDKPVPIASLTKMMTVLLMIEQVQQDPALELTSTFQVSKAAAAVGGSQVYLDPREQFSLRDLLKCVIIFSANDAAYFVAEILSEGNVDEFVARMNRRAEELKLDTMHFYNPHGLPESGNRDNRGSAFDAALLAGKLLSFPEVVRWSSTWVTYIREGTEKKFQLANRNRLVADVEGVNGMKTGYTAKAGFCVAATCERDGRILIAAVTGCDSSTKRNKLVTHLLQWGYQQQEN